MLFGMWPGGPLGQFQSLSTAGYSTNVVSASNAWLGKTNAIVNIFANETDLGELTTDLNNIWNGGSVPMLSYGPLLPTADIANGDDEVEFEALGKDISNYLADGSGRKIYFRFMWEPNIGGNHNGLWSPCDSYGGQATAADYIAAWRYVHSLFQTTFGFNSNDMQWVYSVGAGDSSCAAGAPPSTYPGNNYVDWVGIDYYPVFGQTSIPLTDNAVDGKTEWQELQAVAPGKPIGIDEAGVPDESPTSTYDPSGANKSTVIQSYFNWAYNNGAGMLLWFNEWYPQEINSFSELSSLQNLEYGVFDTDQGDDTFDSGTLDYKVWDGYKTAVNEYATGSTPSSTGLITEAQFQGN